MLVAVLTACPTPEDPKGTGGDDGDGGNDPTTTPDVEVSFSVMNPHVIMPTITTNILLDGDMTLAITKTDVAPTIPNPPVKTDGIITRTFTTKGQARKVYMSQLSANFVRVDATTFPTTIEENYANFNLNAAFMRANTLYYLHIFYTKEGTATLIHKSHSFTTPNYDFTDTNGDGYVEQTAVFHNNSGAEWKATDENFLIVQSMNKDVNEDFSIITDNPTVVFGRCSIIDGCGVDANKHEIAYVGSPRRRTTFFLFKAGSSNKGNLIITYRRENKNINRTIITE